MREYAKRLEALRAALRGRPFYVSALPNIRYLTGFSGSAGHLLVLPDSATLFTDGRYRTQARAEVKGAEVEIPVGSPLAALTARAARLGLKRLAFEQNRIDYGTYRHLHAELTRCRLLPVNEVVEQLRLIKSAAEIEAIRHSVALNSAAFEAVCDRVRPDWTEARLAAELEFTMRTLGAEGAAFPTIVASGAHGALPHAVPRRQPLAPESLTVVDQGAILCGYCSDMTRMVSLGQPGAVQEALLRAVLKAQAAAIDAVRSGVECRTVDWRAREVLNKSKVSGVRLGTVFSHSTGHGVGLEIHEGPRIASRQRKRLATGMVITIEPGAYLEGLAGVRIEDIVVVTEQGCEVLTDTGRELRVLAG